jgi:hypothetical protein
VNRKKFSGLPKIGSITLPPELRRVPEERERRPFGHHRRSAGAGDEQRNDDCQNGCARTGSIGSLNGCPPMMNGVSARQVAQRNARG